MHRFMSENAPTRKNGRYHIVHPETGRKAILSSVSTVARTLSDEYNLNQWKLRQCARGIGIQPHLGALASSVPADDKGTLDGVVKKALIVSEVDKGAILGESAHGLCEQFDRGETIVAPPDVRRHVDTYVNLMERHRLRVHNIEEHVASTTLGVCGRYDRVVICPDGMGRILDIKTGKTLKFSLLEIAIQLALYANCDHIWSNENDRWEPFQATTDYAIVAHIPIVGDESPSMVPIDIRSGLQAAHCALDAREWRRNAKHFALDNAIITAHDKGVSETASAQDEVRAYLAGETGELPNLDRGLAVAIVEPLPPIGGDAPSTPFGETGQEKDTGLAELLRAVSFANSWEEISLIWEQASARGWPTGGIEKAGKERLGQLGLL